MYYFLEIISDDGLKIVSVHGFNVKDKGKETIDKLLPDFRAMYPNAIIDSDQADYGWHGLIKVRFFHKSAVKRIAEAIKDADIVITHSNGANYTHKALKLLKSQGIENHKLHIIHFSPALNRRQKLEELAFKRIDVFASKSDRTVWLSKFLPFHAWGNAGQLGFISNDPRYWLHGFQKPEHSDWFRDPPKALVMNKIYKIRCSL